MSAALLIFLSTDGFAGWLQLGEEGVIARGSGLEGLPPLSDGGQPLRIVAVVPGDEVSLHWAELPEGLSEPQAQAAGRMMAAELAAQPAAEMHVAVGPAQDGLRCIALVSALHMAGWIGRLQEQGLDPDIVVPEPLLLLPPDDGVVRYDKAPLPLFRGKMEAFSIEPELAALATPGIAVSAIDDARFEADLPAALAALPVDLRQGPFAKRRRWKIEWKRVRRMALLALAILLLGFAIQVASILRYTFAADAADEEAIALADSVAPGASPAQLELRLRELGGGPRLIPLAAALFSGIRAVPNVQLSALNFDAASGLRATILADTPASIAAVQQQIAASGLTADAGAIRNEGGRSVTELTVRAR